MASWRCPHFKGLGDSDYLDVTPSLKLIWVFPKIVGFPPKSSILIGFSIINHPFWGIPISGNTHIYIVPESQFLEDNVPSWENQLIGNHFWSLFSEAMLVSGIVSSLVFSFANHCGESKPKEVRGYLWQVTSLFIYIYLPFTIISFFKGSRRRVWFQYVPMGENTMVEPTASDKHPDA